MKNILLITIAILFLNKTNAQCFDKILSGSAHYIAQKTNGTLWGWGYGNFGQLANTTDNNPTPFQLSTVTDWNSIYCGGYNTYAIKNNGTLWGTGNNQYGCLGINSSINAVFSLQQIGSATNWLSIKPSEYFTIALKTEGSIWAWGQNDTYQTGNNVCCVNQLSPVQVGTDIDWVYIETANNASSAFAIKSNGTLWGWGLNLAGLLGPSNVSNRKTPTQLNTDAHWASITVGGAHALALKTNGTLWSWGSGGTGQTGDGLGPTQFRSIPIQTGTDTWISVSAGFRSSFGVKSNGTLWAWGENTYGKLGLGNTINQMFPAQIGSASDWLSVHTTWVFGAQTTIAIKANGTVWGWGDNSVGQLGNGTNTNQLTPVQLTNLCVLDNISFVENTNAIKVYPNPAKDFVNINTGTVIKSIQMYDAQGRIIQTKLSNQENEILDISKYTKGIYFLTIKTDSGKRTEKIIKQ